MLGKTFTSQNVKMGHGPMGACEGSRTTEQVETIIELVKKHK